MVSNGMGCSFTGWGVSIWDWMLVNEMGCYGIVSDTDGVLVNGMGCYLSGMGFLTKRVGV